MTKYKLIKEYPGSPKLGTIVKVESDGYIHWNVNSNNNNPTNYIHGSSMKQYSEFWEEVVKKDYEILSFISTENNIVQLSFFICENNFTGNDTWKIYSIKRLSDGEIFTIGDNVRIVKSTNPCCEQGIIENFAFWLDNINNLEKIKQPLFTTEDGIDIFEGDEFYYVKFVQVNNTIGRPFQSIKGNHLYFRYEPEYEKYFSTKDKAEEYILMNKPVLSLSDVWDHLSIKNRKLIIPFVKNKLNQ